MIEWKQPSLIKPGWLFASIRKYKNLVSSPDFYTFGYQEKLPLKAFDKAFLIVSESKLDRPKRTNEKN